MRIGILHNSYKFRGGEERVAEQESAMLKAAGHHVARLTFDNRVEYAQLGSSLRSALRTGSGWNTHASDRIMDWVRQERLDLVHLHNLFPFITAAGPDALRRLRVPVVGTLHNFRPLCARGTLTREDRPCSDCVSGSSINAIRHACYRDSRIQSLSWAVGRKRFRQARVWQDAITTYIAPSEHVKTRFVKAGFSDDQIVIRPHFTDLVPHHTSQREGVVVVGRVESAKGIPQLAESWPMNAPVLTVVGDGPELGRVQALRRPNVRALGALDRAELSQAIGRARVLISASQLPETFGLTLIEAAASSTPAIAFDSSGAVSIIEDRITGRLIEYGNTSKMLDAAVELARNASDAMAMGRAAHDRYRRLYSPEAGLRSLEAVYSRVIASRRTRVSA